VTSRLGTGKSLIWSQKRKLKIVVIFYFFIVHQWMYSTVKGNRKCLAICVSDERISRRGEGNVGRFVL